MKEAGLPIYAFGYLFSGITLIGSITPYLAKPLLRMIGSERRLLALMIGLQCVFALLVLFVGGWVFGVLLYCAIAFAWDVAQPVERAYFQKFVPSRMRATIISFSSMLISIGYGIAGPVSGFLADSIGTRSTIAIIGLVLLPAAILYLAIREKK